MKYTLKHIYFCKCLNRGFHFPHCLPISSTLIPPLVLMGASYWSCHLSAVQNYLWPGLALFSKTAAMPVPWMSLEGAAVPTVWPENSSCRYTSHQPCDTAHLPSAQRHPDSKDFSPAGATASNLQAWDQAFLLSGGKKSSTAEFHLHSS